MKIKVSCECKDFLALGELTEFQGGLKSRTEFDVDKIVRSIRKYGIAFPLFVWRHDGVNHCLDGHGRLLALKKMREDGDTIPPLPVVYVDCKDEQAARDLLLRLNSHYGTMTADSVREFADGFDVDFTELQLPCGVIDFEVAGMQKTEGDDEAPEADEKEEPDSQPGEMYELGSSILMCGDSTDPDAVARLMGGEKADMVFTDPPYGVSIGDKNKALNSVQKAGRCCENIENDTLPADVLYDVLVKAMTNCRENCKDDASYYVTSPQGGGT
ncbi:MAG: DNA modification methylase [Bacteroidaceae bacterium]|nr:DNA modification methylase [Bacteroidaceae bacterium]